MKIDSKLGLLATLVMLFGMNADAYQCRVTSSADNEVTLLGGFTLLESDNHQSIKVGNETDEEPKIEPICVEEEPNWNTETLANKSECPVAAEIALLSGCIGFADFKYALDNHFAPYCKNNDPGELSRVKLCSLTAIPNMISNFTSNGIVSADGALAGFKDRYAPWQAFNLNSQFWLSPPNSSPTWISYRWNDGVPKKIVQYLITFNNGDEFTSRAPKQWVFQGLGDDGWVDLDSRFGETNWQGHEVREFEVSEPGYYPEYRLLVNEDNDDSADIVAVSIGFLELIEEQQEEEEPVETLLTPPMSDDLSEGGMASISGSYGSTQAYYAFDDNNGTSWLSELWESPVWLQYQWQDGTSKKVTRYEILFTNGSLTSRAPHKWELQGSNDGSSWITLDAQDNQSDWAGTESREFEIESPDDYLTYRLLVLEDNDSRSDIVTVSISRLSLFGY